MDYSLINIKELTKNQIDLVKAKLPLRYEKSLQFLNKDDQLRSISAGYLMLKFLKPFKELDILYNEHGKPYIPDNYHFNISHSGDYVLIAFGDRPIGVDIEKIDQKNLRIAEKMFSKDELEIMKINPLISFHELWTRKEAVLKCLGLGITLDLKSFDVSHFVTPNTISVLNKEYKCLTKIIKDYVINIIEA